LPCPVVTLHWGPVIDAGDLHEEVSPWAPGKYVGFPARPAQPTLTNGAIGVSVPATTSSPMTTFLVSSCGRTSSKQAKLGPEQCPQSLLQAAATGVVASIRAPALGRPLPRLSSEASPCS
ncbi:hypothetical protein HaLaN_31867, partial [Haematococcus lacustris]